MVATKFPQTAHARLPLSLQNEWQFIQRVIFDVGAFFRPVEEAIATIFLPNLFGIKTSDGMTPIKSLRSLTALPVKNIGLGLFNPIDTAHPNCTASTLITSHLTAALKG